MAVIGIEDASSTLMEMVPLFIVEFVPFAGEITLIMKVAPEEITSPWVAPDT